MGDQKKKKVYKFPVAGAGEKPEKRKAPPLLLKQMDRAIYSATTRAICYTPVGKASLKPRSWSGEEEQPDTGQKKPEGRMKKK